MRVRDHLIAAALALAVTAVSLTVGQHPPRQATGTDTEWREYADPPKARTAP